MSSYGREHNGWPQLPPARNRPGHHTSSPPHPSNVPPPDCEFPDIDGNVSQLQEYGNVSKINDA